jgi:hypothetical protein
MVMEGGGIGEPPEDIMRRLVNSSFQDNCPLVLSWAPDKMKVIGSIPATRTPSHLSTRVVSQSLLLPAPVCFLSGGISA